MRKSLITVLLAVLVFTMLAIPLQASIYCKYARFNPGYAVACFWEIMMDLWDPLDWGDGDADDYGNGSVIIEEVEFYCYRTDYSFSCIPRAG